MSHPSDKVMLRLNQPAMNALFPEGSQARIDLQNACLAEASSRYVKRALDDELRTYLDQAVASVVAAVDAPGMIGRAFAKRPHWSGLEVVPSSEVAKAIAVAVDKRYEELVAQRVNAEVEAALARAVEGLDAKVARLVQIKVDQLTYGLMREKVETAFAAAGLTAPVFAK